MASLRVGTRGSALARVQTELVLAQLRTRFPGIEFVVEVRVTEGDRSQPADVPLQQLAGKGVFVKDLQQALLDNEIDFAVHSLKDMTAAEEPGLVLAATPEREDPRDVLVSRTRASLTELPAGARVGTSSPRRAAQLSALRPDLRFEPIRGNVDTRVRKVQQGDYDAAVLAAAGLLRLGLAERITEYFSPDVCLPDPGQGALAVEARAGDRLALDVLTTLDHRPTRTAVTAERALLRALGGGCEVPVGALAEWQDGQLVLQGALASGDGTMVRGTVRGAGDAPQELGRKLAAELLARTNQSVLNA